MSSIGHLGGFGRSPCWKQHPTTYQILGLSRPKLAAGRFFKNSQTQTARIWVICGFGSNLRAKDAKRDRGKQAANTCIDRARGCLRCALTVSQVSCAVATALFSSSFNFVLRVGAVWWTVPGVRSADDGHVGHFLLIVLGLLSLLSVLVGQHF